MGRMKMMETGISVPLLLLCVIRDCAGKKINLLCRLISIFRTLSFPVVWLFFALAITSRAHARDGLALFLFRCLQCFDAVGWAAGRASGL